MRAEKEGSNRYITRTEGNWFKIAQSERVPPFDWERLGSSFLFMKKNIRGTGLRIVVMRSIPEMIDSLDVWAKDEKGAEKLNTWLSIKAHLREAEKWGEEAMESETWGYVEGMKRKAENAYQSIKAAEDALFHMYTEMKNNTGTQK